MSRKGRAVVAAPAPRRRPARSAAQREAVRPKAADAAPLDRKAAKALKVHVPYDRFPGTDGNPALKRALHIHFGMQAGLDRDQAVARAEELLGPRGARAAGREPASPAKARRARPAR